MPAVEKPVNASIIQAFGFVLSQADQRSWVQNQQRPHPMGKGTITRSPAFRVFTSAPTSTTSPMNSWPRMSPRIMVGT